MGTSHMWYTYIHEGQHPYTQNKGIFKTLKIKNQKKFKADKVAERVKALATKSYDLSLDPRSHMVKD